MVLESLQVKHKAFGLGAVISFDGSYITVKFESAEKRFVYPDAFEKYLTLADGTVPEEIMLEVEASKRAKQLIIDRKNEENVRAMTRGIVIPGKEPVHEGEEEENNRYKDEEN